MTEFTKEEYETTYKVLEQLREESDSAKETMFNDVHYLVQIHQVEAE